MPGRFPLSATIPGFKQTPLFTHFSHSSSFILHPSLDLRELNHYGSPANDL
jgi:hypothetical protein